MKENGVVGRLLAAAETVAYAYAYKTGYLRYAQEGFDPAKDDARAVNWLERTTDATIDKLMEKGVYPNR